MSEDEKERLELERNTMEVGRVIAQSLPKGVGFTLILFDLGAGGNLAYCSNGRREDVIRMLEEFRQKALGELPRDAT